jgi:hypothetical protein
MNMTDPETSNTEPEELGQSEQSELEPSPSDSEPPSSDFEPSALIVHIEPESPRVHSESESSRHEPDSSSGNLRSIGRTMSALSLDTVHSDSEPPGLESESPPESPHLGSASIGPSLTAFSVGTVHSEDTLPENIELFVQVTSLTYNEAIFTSRAGEKYKAPITPAMKPRLEMIKHEEREIKIFGEKSEDIEDGAFLFDLDRIDEHPNRKLTGRNIEADDAEGQDKGQSGPVLL